MSQRLKSLRDKEPPIEIDKLDDKFDPIPQKYRSYPLAQHKPPPLLMRQLCPKYPVNSSENTHIHISPQTSPRYKTYLPNRHNVSLT